MNDIKIEFEYAYNVWKEKRALGDETILSLKKCYEHTPCKKIDEASEPYPIEFLNYIDKKIREL